MTTSKTPWHTSPWMNQTAILDQAGNIIGSFKDYRDAEKVIELVNICVSPEEILDMLEETSLPYPSSVEDNE